MKWEVRGANLKTGVDIRETIEAVDYEAVQAELKRRKIAAESIKRVEPSTAKASKPLNASLAKPASLRATEITARMFVVSGIISSILGAIERVFPMLDRPASDDSASRIAFAAASIAPAARSEYLIVTGGACVATGLGLLMLREITLNSRTWNNRD